MNGDVTLRRVEPHEAAVYLDVRLEGLRLHPAAFASSPNDEASVELYRERLARNATFGAFAAGGALLGVATFLQPWADAPKLRHKGLLVAMYVRLAARRRRLATALVERVVAAAREQVSTLLLSVAADNAAAIALYRSCGFRSYGTEPRALFVDGRYHDEELMVLEL